MLLFVSLSFSQRVDFEEYDLSNGLHVILHQDKSVPIVTTSVLYHVGSKDEDPERTGFAHFFEHLLFEGTKNIEKGKWFSIVTGSGGSNNAYTTDDFTYYYENFPSNNLELAIWMESERMLHPVIDKVGVDTQNEVVKEEKRMRYDNSPYGKWNEEVKFNLFKVHPYKQTTIGKIEHLDSATLDEFLAFHKKYYVPNNAVLTVAGDIDILQTKKWIKDYTLAKCKFMLGEARSKFNTIAGPQGGTTLNGDALKQEALAEMERLEAEVKTQTAGGQGYSFLIG